MFFVFILFDDWFKCALSLLELLLGEIYFLHFGYFLLFLFDNFTLSILDWDISLSFFLFQFQYFSGFIRNYWTYFRLCLYVLFVVIHLSVLIFSIVYRRMTPAFELTDASMMIFGWC